MMATRFTRRAVFVDAADGDENPASSSVEGDENNGALLLVQPPRRRCRCREDCDDGRGIDHANIGLVILAAVLLDVVVMPVLVTLSTTLLLLLDDEGNDP